MLGSPGPRRIWVLDNASECVLRPLEAVVLLREPVPGNLGQLGVFPEWALVMLVGRVPGGLASVFCAANGRPHFLGNIALSWLVSSASLVFRLVLVVYLSLDKHHKTRRSPHSSSQADGTAPSSSVSHALFTSGSRFSVAKVRSRRVSILISGLLFLGWPFSGSGCCIISHFFMKLRNAMREWAASGPWAYNHRTACMR